MWVGCFQCNFHSLFIDCRQRKYISLIFGKIGSKWSISVRKVNIDFTELDAFKMFVIVSLFGVRQLMLHHTIFEISLAINNLTSEVILMKRMSGKQIMELAW